VTPQQLLDAHPDVRILSVDLFDTLVTRSVAQPTHVFALMERDLLARDGTRWRGFAGARVLAERRARRTTAAVSEHADVAIQDVMRELACAIVLSPAERRMLMQLEMETELSVTRPVGFGVSLVAEARRRGLGVLVVSDNYMPSSHLAEVLRTAGMDVAQGDIVVSCEHGAMKHDGSLWPVVLGRAAVEAGKVLHVGDLNDADGSHPRRFGIRTHVEPAMRESHREPLNTAPSVLPLSVIEAANRDRGTDAAGNLATGALALVVAGQVLDAVRAVHDSAAVGVHFTSRDGWLAHRAYEHVRRENPGLPAATYSAVSRSLVWRASLGRMDETAASRFVGDDECLSLVRLGARVGCTLLGPKDVPVDGMLDAEAARKVLVANATAVEAACRDLRERYVGYLRSQGLLQPGHHVLVDLGWSGSVVAGLARMVTEESAGAATCEGRFVALYWDATPQRRHLPINGLACDELRPLEDNMRLLGVLRLFEALITAPHGPVEDIRSGEALFGEVIAPSLNGGDWTELADQVVSTATDIVLGRHALVRPGDVTGEVVWAALMQAGHTPTQREVELLSALRHETSVDHGGDGEPVVAPAVLGDSGDTAATYDRLLRHHWLQGSLVSWATRGESVSVVREIQGHQHWTGPVWVTG
jgi:FMN phosphatase YigB (HAD superfamily)